jgi:hypothetical protein
MVDRETNDIEEKDEKGMKGETGLEQYLTGYPSQPERFATSPSHKAIKYALVIQIIWACVLTLGTLEDSVL